MKSIPAESYMNLAGVLSVYENMYFNIEKRYKRIEKDIF